MTTRRYLDQRLRLHQLRLVDGRSLAPLLAGSPSAWRRAYPTTYLQGTAGTQPGWRGVRTEGYAYVEYATGERELYDMTLDPNELQNLAATASPGLLDSLAGWTARLATCAGDACRTADAAVPAAAALRQGLPGSPRAR